MTKVTPISSREIFAVQIVEPASLSFLKRCGKGYLDDGTNVFVVNGRHLVGRTVRVEPQANFEEGGNQCLLARLASANEHLKALAKFQTKYELIPSKYLKRIDDSYPAFRLDDIPVYSDVLSEPVVAFLLTKPELWKMAAVRVALDETRLNRVSMWGVDFREAILHTLHQGKSSSRLFVPNLDYPDLPGMLANLLIRLRRTTERRVAELVLELWHFGLMSNPEVYYVHGYLTKDASCFSHLDGAIIEYTDADVKQLLQSGRASKGKSKQKYFQLDCDDDTPTSPIGIYDAIQIIELFLPQDGLVREYFVHDFSEE